MIVPCKTASALISKSFEQPLSPYEKLKVKIHLFLCQYVGGKDCENYLQQIQMMRELAGRAGEPALQLKEVQKLKLPHKEKKQLKELLARAAKENPPGKK